MNEIKWESTPTWINAGDVCYTIEPQRRHNMNGVIFTMDIKYTFTFYVYITSNFRSYNLVEYAGLCITRTIEFASMIKYVLK